MFSLTTIGFAAGAVLTIFGGAGLFARQATRGVLDAFPRHRPAAVVLTLFNVAWVAIMLYNAPLGRFEWVKPFLFVLAPTTFFLVIHYMDELLAPRMVGGFLLLIASPILDAIRWHESPWRLLLTLIVYVFIVWAMILVLSPYRLRHMTNAVWDGHWRLPFFGLLTLLGVALITLAATVY